MYFVRFLGVAHAHTPAHALLVTHLCSELSPSFGQQKKEKKIKIKETKEKVVSVRWPKKFHAVFEVQKCSIILG